MREDTSEGDGGANQGVEFLVPTNGKLEMAGGDALDLEILGCVLWVDGMLVKTLCYGQQRENTYPRKFEDFGSEILEHRGNVNSRLGADAHLVLCVLLQETLDTAARKLERERSVAATTKEPEFSCGEKEGVSIVLSISARVEVRGPWHRSRIVV